MEPSVDNNVVVVDYIVVVDNTVVVVDNNVVVVDNTVMVVDSVVVDTVFVLLYWSLTFSFFWYFLAIATLIKILIILFAYFNHF